MCRSPPSPCSVPSSLDAEPRRSPDPSRPCSGRLYRDHLRRSIRAFLPAPIPRETVERILDVAARAPSGTNMQPWRVHALAGDALDRFTEAVQAAFLAGAEEPR